MRRKISIPGLDQHPDLKRKFEYELVRSHGCPATCGQSALVKRYGKLMRDREAQSRLVNKR